MAHKNKDRSHKEETRGGGAFSRRKFLFFGGAAAAANFMPVLAASAVTELPANMAAPMAADFHNISQFLTGKELAPQLAERTWWALASHDGGFGAKYKALRDFIASSSAGTIDRLKTDKAFNGVLRQTAISIISAYYLGYVGTPRPLRAHDDTIFITYTQALMYRLNYEYVPIPTYSRRESGFWSSPVRPR